MPADSLTVSVALCTHNGAEFVADQLLSILGQSELPNEIILSDDASVDATVELARRIIDAFVALHPAAEIEFRLLRNSAPLGVTKNFEQAIEACSSQLVALSDQDDIWAPNRLSRVKSIFLERPDLLLLHSDARLVDENGAVLPGTLLGALEVSALAMHAIHEGNAFDVLMRRNVVTGATTIFRRPLFRSAAPFPESWVHDEWLAIVASMLGGVDVLEETLVDYRQHAANQIGVRRLMLFGKMGRMLEPGVERNHRLIERAKALADRLAEMGGDVPQRYVDAAQRKLAHERLRSSLSRHRVLRVVPVIREMLTGRYSEFGRGTLDAVRDLLQPLNSAR